MKNYQFLVMEIKNIHENIQIMKINKVEIKLIKFKQMMAYLANNTLKIAVSNKINKYYQVFYLTILNWIKILNYYFLLFIIYLFGDNIIVNA